MLAYLFHPLSKPSQPRYVVHYANIQKSDRNVKLIITQAEACFPFTISEPIMVSMHCFNLVDRSRPLQPGSTLSHTRGCLFSIINPLLIHNYGSRAILKMNLWDAKWCGIFSG